MAWASVESISGYGMIEHDLIDFSIRISKHKLIIQPFLDEIHIVLVIGGL